MRSCLITIKSFKYVFIERVYKKMAVLVKQNSGIECMGEFCKSGYEL